MSIVLLIVLFREKEHIISKSFCHSGALGDLIYSLPAVKYFGGGDFYVKLHSNELIAARYGYSIASIPNYQKSQFTEKTYEMLVPLLEAQSYIARVYPAKFEDSVDIDLDHFRSVLFRSFQGNHVEAYFKTFNIPYTQQDIITPWLTVPEPKYVGQIVVSRTFRYRNSASEIRWRQYVSLDDFNKVAVFVGLDDEYNDFVKTFCNSTRKVPHYKPKDFLDLAQVIAGADHVISNQTFVYSLAQGLWKNTSVELDPRRQKETAECYFNREGCEYF